MNKMLLIGISVFFIISCNYAHKNQDMKTYHLAFLDTIETSARITYFNPKTIYYIGKLTVNKKTDEIIYQCVNEKECEKLKITASYYLGRDEDGLTLPIGYSLFSLNKPKKQKRTDYIEYLPFDKLWLLGRKTTYGDKDFWLGFEIRGFYDFSTYGYYRVIDSSVGEKYFEEKKTDKGDIELQQAVKLNQLESF